jgi:hypothetical protein
VVVVVVVEQLLGGENILLTRNQACAKQSPALVP